MCCVLAETKKSAKKSAQNLFLRHSKKSAKNQQKIGKKSAKNQQKNWQKRDFGNIRLLEMFKKLSTRELSFLRHMQIPEPRLVRRVVSEAP